MADITYLDFNWAGSETGDYATPYNTMVEAVNGTSDNGVVIIKNGTYSCIAQNWSAGDGKTITIKPESFMGVTLTTTSTISYWSSSVNYIIDGIIFDGGGIVTTHLLDPYQASGYVQIKSCIIRNSTLTRSIFQRCSGLSKISYINSILNVDTDNYSKTLLSMEVPEMEVSRCSIVSNYAESLHCATIFSISNSIVYSSSGADRSAYLADWSRDCASTIILEDNNCYYNFTNYDLYGTNITNVNPLFMSVGDGDLRLSPGSPINGLGGL